MYPVASAWTRRLAKKNSFFISFLRRCQMQSDDQDIMPFWREYPYSEGGVFELESLPWDKDILAVELGSDHGRLPKEYHHATGQIFREDVRRTVLTACPGAKQCPRLPDLDYDLYFALGTENDAAFNSQATRMKEILERRAEQVWLRPGVPKLHCMVTKYLSSRANLVMSLLEIQQKHGYADTRHLVEQSMDCILSQTPYR